MTLDQQTALINAARDWSVSQVPYLYGGWTKAGADCSGAVSGIYAQAGMNIGHLASDGFAKSSLFIPVFGMPQIGDIGWYPGHVVIYSGKTVPGKDVWSASHTGGRPFGAAQSDWFGTPTWYRYIGP